MKQLFEIAKLKQQDGEELALASLPAVFKSCLHQCKSMGIQVDYRKEEDFAKEAAKAAEHAKKGGATPAATTTTGKKKK